MYDSKIINQLYKTALRTEMRKFCIKAEEFQNAIDEMKKAYAPSTDVKYVNYNNPATRCAYLFKYAPLHTALVEYMLGRAIEKDPGVFSSMDNIELCSLGGGPGSDVIGILAAFSKLNPRISISATILDCMKEWKESFNTLIKEIRDEEYGLLSETVWFQNYDFKTYIEADLYKIDDKARRAIASANLITMVKFVSAASFEELQSMISKIFSHMKPGAHILYIDNDFCKFHIVLREEAKRHKLEMMIPPFEHEHFTDSAFKRHMFGFTACYETKVSVYLWQKPFQTSSIPILNTSKDNIKTVKLHRNTTKFPLSQTVTSGQIEERSELEILLEESLNLFSNVHTNITNFSYSEYNCNNFEICNFLESKLELNFPRSVDSNNLFGIAINKLFSLIQ